MQKAEKRPNVTKKLVEDFDGLNTRLASIESAVSQIAQHLNSTHSSIASSTPTASPYHEAIDFSIHTSISGDPFGNNRSGPQPRRYGRSSHRFMDAAGDERFYGQSSAYASFDCTKVRFEKKANSKDNGNLSLIDILIESDPKVSSTLQRLTDLPKTLPMPQASELESDGKPIALPSKALLEVTLEFYLREINDLLPIFDRGTLLKAIDEQYSIGCEHTDPTWILCFNNIILLSLLAKLKTSPPGAPSKDENLMFMLLNNAKRSFSILETLLKPRIASIQALFTLMGKSESNSPQSFVTREFYEHQVAAKHIALAHQMARSIGLHQPGQFVSPERTNLFWSMYIIDKLRLFRCSQGCQSYLFECSVPLPEFDQPSPLEIAFLAKIKMACFLEEIYRELYMNYAQIQPYSSGQTTAMRLLVQLDQEWPDFHARAAILKESFPSVELELRHMFHTNRVLILLRSNLIEHKSRLLEDSRTTLEIIGELKAQQSIRGNMALSNVLHLDPLISFFELFSNIVENPQLSHSRDQELIAMTIERISRQRHPSYISSACARVYESVAICGEIVLAIKQAFPPSSISWEQPVDSRGSYQEFQSQSQLTWPVKHDWSVDDLLSIDTQNPDLYLTIPRYHFNDEQGQF
ncbi:hypothetical protein BOTNAR_0077g00110 [Botryotinia narcissicola]|uniref:Xylanolytic transcriptional activator regulatory domain-containing protein n=1 Tax=Botryotinia narcissicola TaxID=278944 RepID=A0A4Z1IVT2_9HELO|nr:hypothetical protein BOTNAR_0077g00110 [Botryotinia narcissicola]